MENLIGTTIGNYQVVEKLGRGGMANVYKAYHPGLAVHRALKVIRPELVGEHGFSERFRLEARAVAGLRHPNIVQVHDFGEHENLFYMVMEFVEGENLRERIQREGPIRPFTEALRLVEQLAAGLGYAHENDVLHRDVKPENVLLSTDGQAILADFGIAKMLASSDPKLTATGIGIGTPAYMAPELAMGSTELTPAADLYAVGVVLYETLTAHSPFTADTPLAVLQKVIHDPVPEPRAFTADIPDALQGVVLKSMAKNPAMRYPSAAAFIEASRQSMLGMGPDQTPQGGNPAIPPLPPSALIPDHPTTPIASSAGAMPTPPLPPTQPLAATTPAANAPQTEDTASSAYAPPRGRGPLIALVAVACFLMLALAGGAAMVGWRWYNDRQPLIAETPETAEPLTLADGGLDTGLDEAEDSSAGPETEALADAGLSGDAGAPETSAPLSAPGASPGGSSAGDGQVDGSSPGGHGASAEQLASASSPTRSDDIQGRSVGQDSDDRQDGAARQDSRAMQGDGGVPSSTQSLATGGSATPGASGATGREADPSDVVRVASGTDSGDLRSNERARQTPPAAPQAAPGPRFAGNLRFGYASFGEVEPEEVVAYALEVRRPTTMFFDIVSANRRGTYTLFDPDGEIVFQQRGNDFGPLRLESTGTYNLTVETDSELPLEFEVAFVRTGS